MGKIQDEFQNSRWVTEWRHYIQSQRIQGKTMMEVGWCVIAWRRKCWTPQVETPVLLLFNGFCVIQTCKLLCFSFFTYSRGRILLQLSPLTTGKVKGEIWLVSDVLLLSFHLTWLPSSWQCFKAACVLSGSFSLAPEALLSMLSTQDDDNDWHYVISGGPWF